MPENNKARIRRTITDLGFFPITAYDENGVPTYGDAIWFQHHKAGGRDYDAQPAGNSGGIWADGREVYAYEDNQGYNISLTTVGVTDDIDEAWYGRTVLTDGSVEEYPHFALVIIEDTTDGLGEPTIFYDCHIQQRSGKQGATSEGNGLNPQFPQHNIAARPRPDCMAVKRTMPAKTKITALPAPSKADPPAAYINIRQSVATVLEGETVKLTILSMYPEDAVITWTSSDTTKATVASDGTVTGGSAGTATITASITTTGGTFTDTCTVTVISDE